jgi:hypothetical protein
MAVRFFAQVRFYYQEQIIRKNHKINENLFLKKRLMLIRPFHLYFKKEKGYDIKHLPKSIIIFLFYLIFNP